MARMMDRMMAESLQPFGFARISTSSRSGGNKNDDPSGPRDGLRTEQSEMRRDRAKVGPSNTHAAMGTRHPPTQSEYEVRK